MSSVHDAIALQALAVLPQKVRTLFEPYRQDLIDSSWYPDLFADRSMSPEEKHKIDPEAERFIYPPPPQTTWYRKILDCTEQEANCGMSPLRQIHLISYYLKNAVKSLREGDVRSTVKFCGVYSHVIADTVEPIHALNPALVDLVLPPPETHVGMELHANVEKLKAPVNVNGYIPQVLGRNIAEAEMRTYSALVHARDIGKAQTIPIVQALYAGKRDKAVRLSQIAQNASAKTFADFMYTVYELHRENKNVRSKSIDLCDYPFVKAEVDMLYRHRPMVDISLIPYSNGRHHPLCVNVHNGERKNVHGLGVLPFMGPPFSTDCRREATIEYFLVPGAFRKFRATIGCNPLFTDAFTPVVFRVFGNGQELFRSPILKPQAPGVEIEVKLNKIRWLTLAMHYAENPTFADAQELQCAWASHGVWGDPVLE